jgi:periplasmic copper chaperone A
MSRSALRTMALAAFLLPALAAPAAAQVQVSGAWVRETLPGQAASVAYMRLRSAQRAAVVAVECPIGLAELHQMRMDGDIMRMRPLKRLELPAGRTVEMGPNGAHVMLTRLRRPLAPGERVPLRLTVQTPGKGRSTVDVMAEVRALESLGR